MSNTRYHSIGLKAKKNKNIRQGVNLICESKMKPRLRAEELTGMISLPRDKVVSRENLSRCCFVPMSRNSVLDGLRSNLLEFIQESMSEKVLESISSEEVKEMYMIN